MLLILSSVPIHLFLNSEEMSRTYLMSSFVDRLGLGGPLMNLFGCRYIDLNNKEFGIGFMKMHKAWQGQEGSY